MSVWGLQGQATDMESSVYNVLDGFDVIVTCATVIRETLELTIYQVAEKTGMVLS